MDIIQFLQEGQSLIELSERKKKVLAMKIAHSSFINGHLYKMGPNNVLHQCALEHER